MVENPPANKSTPCPYEATLLRLGYRVDNVDWRSETAKRNLSAVCVDVVDCGRQKDCTKTRRQECRRHRASHALLGRPSRRTDRQTEAQQILSGGRQSCAAVPVWRQYPTWYARIHISVLWTKRISMLAAVRIRHRTFIFTIALL